MQNGKQNNGWGKYEFHVLKVLEEQRIKDDELEKGITDNKVAIATIRERVSALSVGKIATMAGVGTALLVKLVEELIKVILTHLK